MSKQKSNLKTLLVLVISLCLSFSLAQQDKTMEWKSTISPGQIKYIPNVAYLGQGYNLFYGNPQSIDGLDPGYRNSPLIELQYQDNLWDAVSPDRAYFIPDGVRLTTEKSCLITFASKEVSSMKQYQDNLSLSVSGNGEMFAASFSASADFKLMQSELSQSDTQCIQSQASCSAFHLSFYIQGSLPPLSTQLLDKIAYLDAKSSVQNEKDYYLDFFESWGTHITVSVKLGSLFGYKFSMSSSEVKKQASLGLDVTVGASLYGVSGKVSTDYQQQQLNNFKSAMKSWSSYSIGALPNQNLDASEWATQTLDRPMPIQTQLTPIYEYIKQYINTTYTGQIATQIQNVQTKMQQYLGDYCVDRLQYTSQVGSCGGYVQQTQNSYTGSKRIKNIKSGKYIEYNTQTSAVVQKTDSSSNVNQQFSISRPLNNEDAHEINVNNGQRLCLGVNTVSDNSPLITKPCSQDSTTLFSIEEIGQGFQFIKLIGSSYYVTVESTQFLQDTSDNARLILTTGKSTCRGCTFFKIA